MKIRADQVQDKISAGKIQPHEAVYTRQSLAYVAKSVRGETLTAVRRHLAKDMNLSEKEAESFTQRVVDALVAEYKIRQACVS